MSTAISELAEKQPQSLGSKIDELNELRERKRELVAELKEVEERYAALEAEIMSDLDSMGIDLARGSTARVSISETTVPTVEDWDAFYEYVKSQDALYLLERRVAARAWRELYESGELVPGTSPFVRRKLSLRKV